MDVRHVASGLGSLSVDRALDQIASRQHGLLLTEQLRGLGLGPGAIASRVQRDRLFRVHRGVFLQGRSSITRRGEMLAGVLALGAGSLLSHGPALELWGARGEGAGEIHVIATGRRRSRPGLRAHRAEALEPTDCAAIADIPLTAPARSLLDFAVGADPGALESALNEARAEKLVRAGDLEELRPRTHGHHGWAALGRLLQLETEPDFSRREAELRLLRLIREANLPEPRRNVRLCGYEVDLYWPERRLVVEVDSYAYHSSRRAFERDRRKQAELIDHGLEVMRFTWRQIVHERIWLIARLAGRLAR